MRKLSYAKSNFQIISEILILMTQFGPFSGEIWKFDIYLSVRDYLKHKKQKKSECWFSGKWLFCSPKGQQKLISDIFTIIYCDFSEDNLRKTYYFLGFLRFFNAVSCNSLKKAFTRTLPLKILIAVICKPLGRKE